MQSSAIHSKIVVNLLVRASSMQEKIRLSQTTKEFKYKQFETECYFNSLADIVNSPSVIVI